jgi:dienelactone hydrolase
VIANGPITQPFGTTEGRDGKSMMAAKHPSSQAYQLTESVNWAFAGAAGSKYGTPDTSKIAVAGQSCGGIQAYSAAYKDARIKFVGIFNSGVFAGNQRALLAQIKQPVALFHGGPLDIAYQNVSDEGACILHRYARCDHYCLISHSE